MTGYTFEPDRPDPKPKGRARPEVLWSWYVEGKAHDAPDLETALALAKTGDGFVWVGLHHPSEQTMVRLGAQLGIHELVIEDAVLGHRRSKLERFDDTLFMVVSTVSYVDRTAPATDADGEEHEAGPEIVSTGELMIALGPHWVLTSRHHGKSRMAEVRAEVDDASDEMPDGPWRVLHACLSVAADDFVRVVGQMEEDVEECEEGVFAQTRHTEIDRAYQIKRELIEFRRCVAPLCGPLSQLAQRDYAVIPDDARPYFRELNDVVVEVRENIVAMEDQLTNILQAALARASIEDNRDMRKISAAVAILAVPTTLGAVYGMNFDNIPELHWQYGYFVLMGVNLVLMLVLYLIFRRIKWL
ncbi:MAG: magnesium and cobalt transport protein CorA [Micropruina sp.]|nr:MAG: magnesium and cobalt transport protein CorA [Micropruina sp.]